MAIKTENLAIVFTDIVGYTETTAHQSRRENEKLLATHNHILLPIAKRYKGRLIKTIGDALLLVYKSPTDAMLCSMAMQDALYEYNRSVSDEKQIHIRVAASLGEVRVTRNDIFGEPVNITSRIEGVTPKDEIYFSEAIYMAMNKAEVPCQEVGWKELKGVKGKIRLFNIPRFATPRLVPEDVMATEDISDLVYPYGGAHLTAMINASEGVSFGGEENRGKLMILGGVLAVAAVVASGAYVYSQRSPMQVVEAPTETSKAVTPEPKPLPEVKLAPRPEPKIVVVPPPRPVAKVKPKPRSKPKPVAKVKHKHKPKPVAKSRPAAKPKPVVKAKPKPKPKSRPAPRKVAKKAPLKADHGLEYTSLKELKTLLRNKEIDRREYKQHVKAIKKQIKQEMRPVREDLESGAITKREYKQEMKEIRANYK
ncbi:MAG: hypothetical protein BMS9Abin36_1485 [Gammaproteobacteria bacterium]|nr:MAG: hypothetical protein BMS9Abin36_1485 [Gammaproteobacteria bacterium]